MYEVFISHSSLDAKIAQAVCHALEQEKVRCWMAPRDIKPGDVWAEAIYGGIKASKVFVLIISDHSIESKQVLKELTLAVDNGMPIFPLKITEAQPEGAFGYYLSDTHWLDAVSQTMEASIRQMTNVVLSCLYPNRGAENTDSTKNDEQSTKGYDQNAPVNDSAKERGQAEIHIDVDVDCDLFRFKNKIATLLADHDNTIYLNPGKHKFEFVAKEHPDVKQTLTYTLAPDIYSDFIEMSFRRKLEAKALYEAAREVGDEDEDDEDQVNLLTKAAELGHRSAMMQLASYYEDGCCGLDKNEQKAQEWYDKAIKGAQDEAEQGDADAQLALAAGYALGKGGLGQSDEKTIYWLKKSAAQNNKYAMELLADAYLKGDFGIECDKKEAIKLLSKVAKLGDENAQHLLKELTAMNISIIGGVYAGQTSLLYGMIGYWKRHFAATYEKTQYEFGYEDKSDENPYIDAYAKKGYLNMDIKKDIDDLELPHKSQMINEDETHPFNTHCTIPRPDRHSAFHLYLNDTAGEWIEGYNPRFMDSIIEKTNRIIICIPPRIIDYDYGPEQREFNEDTIRAILHKLVLGRQGGQLIPVDIVLTMSYMQSLSLANLDSKDAIRSYLLDELDLRAMLKDIEACGFHVDYFATSVARKDDKGLQALCDSIMHDMEQEAEAVEDTDSAHDML